MLPLCRAASRPLLPSLLPSHLPSASPLLHSLLPPAPPPRPLLRPSVGVSRSYKILTRPPPGPVKPLIVSVVTTPPFAKFDETVSLQLHVTLDPRKPNQNLRGSLRLPAGSGKELRCLVLTASDAARAQGVAAGGEAPPDGLTLAEVVKKLQGGDLSPVAGVDRIIAQPGDMRLLAAAGKALGPRGLMPNPKSGTVAEDLGRAVADARKGSVLVRVGKDGGINVPVGKVSMGVDKIAANVKSVMEQLNDLKPTEGKGIKTGSRFWVSAYLSRTMHPRSYEVDTQTLDPASSRFFRGGEAPADQGKEEAA